MYTSIPTSAIRTGWRGAISAALATCLAVPAFADEPTKITFEDHIKPILREHCSSCHNANDKKSGLSLDNYQAIMAGGSGGEVVAEGDLDSSRLFALTAHKEQPFMPPMQDKIPQAKLDLLKTWIEQGMPENSGSEIKKPMVSSAALGVVSAGRPEGAPPMPVSTLKQTPFYTPRASTISALAASPWSPLVAVGGQFQVSLYHSETGSLLGVIPFPEGEPQSITFSRDGRLILIGGGRHSAAGYAVLHEIATGNRIARVGDELDIVMAADISDDNRMIALAGPQKMIRVYDTLSGKLLFEQKKHTDWIYAVRFSPDGLLLATADRAAGIVVWESATGRMYLELPGHKGEIRSLTWRPDSQALISASLDGTLKMWEMNEGKVIKSWDAHGGGATAVAVCNDGTIVSTGRDNKVKVWDGAGNAAGEMPPLVEAGYEVAITVDGKQVIAGDWAGNVRMWQRANPADEKRLPANPPTLELSLAAAQGQHGPLVANAQTAQNEFNAQQAQLVVVQKQLIELQMQIADLGKQSMATVDAANQLKTQVDALKAQLVAKQNEFTAAQELVTNKTNAINGANAKAKELTDAIAAKTAMKAAEGADVASLDAQIAELNTQVQANAATLTQLQTELQAAQTGAAAKQKEVSDVQAAIPPKEAEYTATNTKATELVAAKAAAEQKLEPSMTAVKTATDAVAAVQTKLDASNAAVAVSLKNLESIQADLAKFNSYASEIAAKKASAEQVIAQSRTELAPIETTMAATKTQLDQSAQGIAKIEEQLASLQAMLAAEKAKQAEIQAAMNTQKQSADAVQTKIMQLESDLASVVMQQQLFEQAYQKKP